MIRSETLERKRLESGYYNMTCPICGRRFHRKPHTLRVNSQRYGITCSLACSREIRRIAMSGENNHQYGLKGHNNASFLVGSRVRKNNTLQEKMVYVGDWHKRSVCGRIQEHRYIVELNHTLFGDDNFDFVEGWYYLKRGRIVHHIDCNHDNNSLDNLCVVTKSEHTRIHNLASPRPRNNQGQFIK